MKNKPRIWHESTMSHSLALLLATVFILLCPPALADTEKNALTFTGNSFFPPKELLKAAGGDIEELGDSALSKAAVDDAAFNMELFYRQAGFAFAEVEYEFSQDNGQGQATFLITEGPQVVLHSIELTGVLSYDPATLRRFFDKNGKNGLLSSRKHYYVKTSLADGLSSLRNFYVNEGFLDVQVNDPQLTYTKERDGVNIAIAVQEGPLYRVQEVLFSGDLYEALSNKLAEIRESLLNSPYYVRQKLVLQSRILEIYANAGYPDSQVNITVTTKPETGNVTLHGDIISGSPVRISGVTVSGNVRTTEDFIKSRIHLESGDLYTMEKTRKTFSSLYETGLFSRVDVELGQADENPAQRPLEVKVEESPAKDFYIEPGWGSYEMLSLTTGFEDRNMFGSGRLGRVEGKLSMKGELFSLRFVDPWLLGSRNVADVPFFYVRREEPSFTRNEFGGSFMMSRDLRKQQTLTLGYHLKISNITDFDEFAEIESPETTYNTGSIKAQLSWDTRDDYFFPQKGSRIAGAVEIAHPVFGSELEFTRLTLGARSFFSLPRAFVLGLRYDTGIILPGSKNFIMPIGEKFFNGGENSVRSFKEAQLGPLDDAGDSVGGLGYNTFTIELRKRFFENLSGSLFADFGNMAPNQSRSELNLAPFSSRSEVVRTTTRDFFSDFRPGLGCGVQYFLPIGPARLDIAFNPDNDPERDEPEMTVHFSLGMAF